MRIKDQLVLREIAGQYVIVPVMDRVKEVPAMVYISSSAAYLWENMQNKEFSTDELTELIMKKYKSVTEEQAKNDIDAFLKVLERNNILEQDGSTE